MRSGRERKGRLLVSELRPVVAVETGVLLGLRDRDLLDPDDREHHVAPNPSLGRRLTEVLGSARKERRGVLLAQARALGDVDHSLRPCQSLGQAFGRGHVGAGLFREGDHLVATALRQADQLRTDQARGPNNSDVHNFLLAEGLRLPPMPMLPFFAILESFPECLLEAERPASDLSARADESHSLMNASRSALSRSWWVLGRPWGAPS